ncbi:predicted protein [Naegleria gruberi]|uniref:Predicted protein n=1 Tax=Naegleria gruberi TaxID=5762 RepID=D2W3F0_NAEGR|nr:uncharacterized protein NAEGRDRAFT_75921 [Naegleria gruberi]EFC36408.1 predicted protein [Naegleria gruberi]|eukprot:XP_002669152.1 predicted protein [Naegleria gruberi strain NEG-M]
MFKHTILCGFVLILILSCFANAQTCNNTAIPFQATACTGCKTCTGVGSGVSCCDATMDALITSQIAVSNVLGGLSPECTAKITKKSCAICDPKNQGYVTYSQGQYEVSVCKSACLEMKAVCPTLANLLDCTAYPETNCWSAANSLNQGAAILFILSILVALFF